MKAFMGKSCLHILLCSTLLSVGLNLNAEERSSLEALQWGLENTGQVFQRDTGELTRDSLPGKRGMDISWVQETFDVSRRVNVAVIDSGIDADHPELKGRLWQRPDCRFEKKDQCAGWNFLENSSDIDDDMGHGTHVAGIIASNWDQMGVAGVAAPQIRIMPLKVLNKKVEGFVYKGQLITNIMAKALRFARTNGADVVNMSLGWPGFVQNPNFIREVKETLKAGIPIVVAAGNNRKNIPTYPCSMEGVICVGAIDHQGQVAEFTNFGGKVDLLAPGENIVSLYPQNLESRRLRIQGYELKKGSSQAAPFVTGIAATLKLLHPELSLGRLRARLLGTAQTGTEFCRAGVSKFGCVSMKKAMEAESEYFAEPLFKNLLEVPFDAKQRFSLQIPVKNWLAPIDDLKVSVRLQGELAQLDKNQFELSLNEGETKVLQLQGELLKLRVDSHTDIEVTLSSESVGMEKRFQTMLAFSRDIQKHPAFKKVAIQANPREVPLRELLQFRGKRKLSRLSRVEDRQNYTAGKDFYYAKAKRDRSMNVFLYHVGSPRQGVKKLELPKVKKVLSVLEGKFHPAQEESGYMVYSLGRNRDLLLSFFDAQGKELYRKNSHWRFPLSTFRGLPVQGGKHTFQWLRYRSTELSQYLGENINEVFVPAFMRKWFVPEEDNTWDLLDRIPRKKANHYYYLQPTLNEKSSELELKLRALDGYQLRTRLREELELVFGESMNVMPGLEQSREQIERGEVVVPLAIGESSLKKVWGLRVTAVESERERLSFQADLQFWRQRHLLMSNNLPVSMRKMKNGNVSSTHMFAALRNRQELRLGLVSKTSGAQGKFSVRTESWSDQIFAPLAFYTEEGKGVTGFIEARYHMYASFAEEEGKRELKKLPLNRDSAFPGVEFSELFRPTRIKQKKERLSEWAPSIYVDSTMIFGDRVYLMSLEDKRFLRPAYSSLKVPERCSPLGVLSEPEIAFDVSLEDQNVSYMSFLCRDAQGRTQWGLFPLKP